MKGVNIKKHLLKHETKKNVLSRFLIILGIFLVYLVLMSFKYGLDKGVLISLLSWSFFVFCTPIADAGFLIDFPARLLTGIRMIHSEMIVWTFAASLNIYSIIFKSAIYEKTILLQLFHKIITTPIPYWIIILLSAAGTFLSVYFGDELIDVSKHKERKKFRKHKNKLILMVGLFILVVTIFFLYKKLIHQLGIHI